jgi:hypothetical protein
MQPKRVVLVLAIVPLLVALGPGAGAGHHPQAPGDVPSEVATLAQGGTELPADDIRPFVQPEIELPADEPEGQSLSPRGH